jgi:hypothetical protein
LQFSQWVELKLLFVRQNNVSCEQCDVCGEGNQLHRKLLQQAASTLNYFYDLYIQTKGWYFTRIHGLKIYLSYICHIFVIYLTILVVSKTIKCMPRGKLSLTMRAVLSLKIDIFACGRSPQKGWLEIATISGIGLSTLNEMWPIFGQRL